MIRMTRHVSWRLSRDDSVELGKIEVIKPQIRTKDGLKARLVRKHPPDLCVDSQAAQCILQSHVETFRSADFAGGGCHSQDGDLVIHNSPVSPRWRSLLERLAHEAGH